MLKHIVLNQKKVPVPVPIRNLKEAMTWVESHLLRPDHTITKVILDDRDIELEIEGQSMTSYQLNDGSRLELRIDSPTEISVQTIDALRNLITAMERSLKPMAVKCWQSESSDPPVDLTTLCGDIDLILDLIDHVIVLLDKRISLANIKMIYHKIQQSAVAMQMAIGECNWKSTAKIILQQLEGSIVELNNELCMMQKSIFETAADRSSLSMEG